MESMEIKEEIIVRKNKDGELVVSSRQIADDFGKRHTDVLRAIEDKMEVNAILRSPKYFIEATYTDKSNRKSKEYLLTRDGFSFLVMGFTGAKADEWKLKYIEAFNKMEQAIKNPFGDLSKELQAIFMLDNRTEKLQIEFNEHKEIVNRYIDNQELSMAESKRLTKLANKIIVSLLGGKQSAAYKKLNKKLFSDLYKQLHREFGITSIAEIKQKDIYIAREIINKYKPPIFLINEIDNINKQISFDEEKM